MQTEKLEKSLIKINENVNSIFEFIKENAEKIEAHEMELEIKRKILLLGRDFMERYFLAKGMGNKGLEIKIESNNYKIEKRVYKRNYYSIFGNIEIERVCYKSRGCENIYPLDIEANLPKRTYSYPLQELMNLNSLKHAYKDSKETLNKFLGIDLSVNMLEIISKESVFEYENFYENNKKEKTELEIMVNSFDGKGIPMTKKAGEKIKGKSENKSEDGSKIRLGKSEKKQKKKEALAGVCYESEPRYRTVEEISNNLVFGSKADKKIIISKNKNIRRMASVEKSKKKVIEEIKEESNKRDPKQEKILAVIMDGAPCLWKIVLSVYKDKEFIPILDIIHVVEYLWDACNAVLGEKSADRFVWVYNKLIDILKGNILNVIKDLEIIEKIKNISNDSLKQLNRSIKYFKNHIEWMKYDKYLEKGLPIASGVVESTCGHLIKDRMELAGSKWNILGAESILKLRSIKTSNNWDEYWNYNIFKKRETLYKNLKLVI